VISQGISKVESTVPFNILESANRKIIDPIAKRYFFVADPVLLFVEDAPDKTKEISLHPSNKDLGSRVIKTSNIFYVSRADMEKLNIGDIFRLKELFNVKILKKDKKKILGGYAGEKLIPDSLKIQWVTDDFIEITVFVPHPLFIDDKYNENSLEKINGFAEKAVNDLKTGEIIQFERFGFVRIENKNGKITGFYTHK